MSKRPRTLLARIEDPGPPEERDLPGDPRFMIESIREHLQHMLNTRHNGSSSAPDYGLAALSELYQGHSTSKQVEDEIRNSIEKYEPRLADVDVSFEQSKDTPWEIVFHILGTIVTDEDQKVPTVFRTVVDASGELKVNKGEE